MQFRVAWKCEEYLYQLINDYLCPEAIRPVGSVSLSVCHCKQLPPPSVHVILLKPCITVHKHPSVTLCRILFTCHKCRCSQRILLPKWGYIRRYRANGPHGSLHGCEWRTVTFQQLYESTVSFCVLSSIEFTLHCSTTLGGTNRQRFNPFYNFPKQKINHTEMSI